MNLHDIATEYKQMVELGFDENSQVFIDTVKQPLEQKGQNIALVLNQWKSEANMIDAEIKRLQAMKTIRVNSDKRLRKWLKDNMIQSDISQIKSDLFTITLGKAPKNTVVEIEDETKIKKEYKVEKWTVNKTAIKQALKDGYVVDGAKLVDGQRSLRIK